MNLHASLHCFVPCFIRSLLSQFFNWSWNQCKIMECSTDSSRSQTRRQGLMIEIAFDKHCRVEFSQITSLFNGSKIAVSRLHAIPAKKWREIYLLHVLSGTVQLNRRCRTTHWGIHAPQLSVVGNWKVTLCSFLIHNTFSGIWCLDVWPSENKLYLADIWG